MFKDISISIVIDLYDNKKIEAPDPKTILVKGDVSLNRVKDE